MPTTDSKRIAITMGDPAGVGAEVIVKAAAQLPEAVRDQLVVVGSAETLEKAIAATGTALKLGPVDAPAASALLRLDHVNVAGMPLPFGKLDPVGGDASYRYIARAVELTTEGSTAGIVTAPINKEALNLAGHHFDGHTGMLAHLTGWCYDEWFDVTLSNWRQPIAMRL